MWILRGCVLETNNSKQFDGRHHGTYPAPSYFTMLWRNIEFAYYLGFSFTYPAPPHPHPCVMTEKFPTNVKNRRDSMDIRGVSKYYYSVRDNNNCCYITHCGTDRQTLFKKTTTCILDCRIL